MSEKEKIINIAVIAHVDAGKSTLVDAFLRQRRSCQLYYGLQRSRKRTWNHHLF